MTPQEDIFPSQTMTAWNVNGRERQRGLAAELQHAQHEAAEAVAARERLEKQLLLSQAQVSKTGLCRLSALSLLVCDICKSHVRVSQALTGLNGRQKSQHIKGTASGSRSWHKRSRCCPSSAWPIPACGNSSMTQWRHLHRYQDRQGGRRILPCNSNWLTAKAVL